MNTSRPKLSVWLHVCDSDRREWKRLNSCCSHRYDTVEPKHPRVCLCGVFRLHLFLQTAHWAAGSNQLASLQGRTHTHTHTRTTTHTHTRNTTHTHTRRTNTHQHTQTPQHNTHQYTLTHASTHTHRTHTITHTHTTQHTPHTHHTHTHTRTHIKKSLCVFFLWSPYASTSFCVLMTSVVFVQMFILNSYLNC